jgi:hypothetical protein
LAINGTVTHHQLNEFNDYLMINGLRFHDIQECIGFYCVHPFVEDVRLIPIESIDDSAKEQAQNTIDENQDGIFEFEGHFANQVITKFCYLICLNFKIQMLSHTEFTTHDYNDEEVTVPPASTFFALYATGNKCKISYNYKLCWVDLDIVKESSWKFDLNNDEFLVYLHGVEKLPDDPESTEEGKARFPIKFNHKDHMLKCFKFAVTEGLYANWKNQINAQIDKIKKLEETQQPDMSHAWNEIIPICRGRKFTKEEMQNPRPEWYCYVQSLSARFFRSCKFALNNFNNILLTRTYPEGFRAFSGNYNPIPCWNMGCQMVDFELMFANNCAFRLH